MLRKLHLWCTMTNKNALIRQTWDLHIKWILDVKMSGARLNRLSYLLHLHAMFEDFARFLCTKTLMHPNVTLNGRVDYVKRVYTTFTEKKASLNLPGMYWLHEYKNKRVELAVIFGLNQRNSTQSTSFILVIVQFCEVHSKVNLPRLLLLSHQVSTLSQFLSLLFTLQVAV